MRGIRKMLALDTVGSAVFSAILSGLCSALWFYQAFRYGGDTLNLIAGIAWLAAAVVWSLRADRVHKNKEEAL